MTTLSTRGGWLLPTPFGRFELEPLRPLKDLAVLHAWMNDPEVAAFWDLAGPRRCWTGTSPRCCPRRTRSRAWAGSTARP
ncbi:GNAT family N-acetyltransferase [Catenulispora yoronensis]